jgi:hypothetical protein
MAAGMPCMPPPSLSAVEAGQERVHTRAQRRRLDGRGAEVAGGTAGGVLLKSLSHSMPAAACTSSQARIQKKPSLFLDGFTCSLCYYHYRVRAGGYVLAKWLSRRRKGCRKRSWRSRPSCTVGHGMVGEATTAADMRCKMAEPGTTGSQATCVEGGEVVATPESQPLANHTGYNCCMPPS